MVMRKIIIIAVMLMLSIVTYISMVQTETINAPLSIVVLCIGILLGLLIAALATIKKHLN